MERMGMLWWLDHDDCLGATLAREGDCRSPPLRASAVICV
jgi:hypothetical protein